MRHSSSLRRSAFLLRSCDSRHRLASPRGRTARLQRCALPRSDGRPRSRSLSPAPSPFPPAVLGLDPSLLALPLRLLRPCRRRRPCQRKLGWGAYLLHHRAPFRSIAPPLPHPCQIHTHYSLLLDGALRRRNDTTSCKVLSTSGPSSTVSTQQVCPPGHPSLPFVLCDLPR